jgi:hypothetical protein
MVAIVIAAGHDTYAGVFGAMIIRNTGEWRGPVASRVSTIVPVPSMHTPTS